MLAKARSLVTDKSARSNMKYRLQSFRQTFRQCVAASASFFFLIWRLVLDKVRQIGVWEARNLMQAWEMLPFQNIFMTLAFLCFVKFFKLLLFFFWRENLLPNLQVFTRELHRLWPPEFSTSFPSHTFFKFNFVLRSAEGELASLRTLAVSVGCVYRKPLNQIELKLVVKELSAWKLKLKWTPKYHV